MRRGTVLLLFVLTGCPPESPIDQSCSRFLVDSSGNVNGGAGGGPGTAPFPPIGVVGTPLSLTVFAPLTSCVSDTLRADAQVTDPDNLPLAVAREPPQVTGVQGAVKATLTFTPTRPGLHTLHVAFEPSLGVRSLLVDVAADGLAGAMTRVPIPTGANCKAHSLWPLSDDTVACEERSRGLVTLTTSDGGLTQFNGRELVVVDTVLWSIDGASSTLERRVFEDGGVRVTHRFPNFPATSTPAMHDVGTALRSRPDGHLALVQLEPPRVLELALRNDVGPPLAYFAEGNDVVYRWSQTSCSFDECVSVPDLVAVEPGHVWRTDTSFPELPSRTSWAFTRPLTPDAVPQFTLHYPLESLATPAGAFERMPLWLNVDSGGAGRRVLVSFEQGAPGFTAWPRREVLRVGRKHLLLDDPDPGYVRVWRR